MGKGNLKTERPYLRFENRAFHFLSPYDGQMKDK
jgi:hypothetical protein